LSEVEKLRRLLSNQELLFNELVRKVGEVKGLMNEIEEILDDARRNLADIRNLVEGEWFKVEVACKSVNEVHGEDSFRLIDSNLKGFVVCDGVTNANGAVASSTVASAFKWAFDEFVAPAGLEDTVRNALKDALAELKDELKEKGFESSATTFILALTDGLSFYIYYSGDGYIYHFRGDLGAYATYMLPHSYGSQLFGYVGYVNGREFSLYNSIRVKPCLEHGSFLVIGTDGTELERGPKGGLAKFYEKLSKVKKGEMKLEECIEEYLENLKKSGLNDDATLGVIWLRRDNDEC